MYKLLKDIKGVFTPPIKFWYIGAIKYYAPYFEPRGYLGAILKIRKLEPLNEAQLAENKKKGYGWAKEKWANKPAVRRCWGRELTFLRNTYYVQLGWPLAYVKNAGSWKDKFNSPRIEWPPFKQIWFFGLQIHIGYRAPTHKADSDSYWEQLLWWYFYCNKDIKKAKETWGWTYAETGESTWDDSIVL